MQGQCLTERSNAVVLQQMAHILYFDSKSGVRYPQLAESSFSPIFVRRKSLKRIGLTCKTVLRYSAFLTAGVLHTVALDLGPIEIPKFL
jgi:hypothetical protein